MPTPVPSFPVESYVNSNAVASPVYGRTTVGPWIQTSNFLVGSNLSPFLSTGVQQLSASTATPLTGTMYIQYQKSPATQFVCFEFELWTPYGAASSPKTLTIDLGLPPSAYYATSGSMVNSAVAKTERQIALYPTSSAGRQVIREFVDVSNCVSTSVLVFTGSWYAMTGSSIAATAHGFRTVTAFEVPRQQLINFTTDPGVEESWGRASMDMADSFIDTTSSPKKKYGFQEIVRNLDIARQRNRNQIQLSSLYDVEKNWVFIKPYGFGTETALSYGVGTNNANSSNRVFYLRAKNTYGLTTTTCPYNISVIYSTSAGGTKPYLFLNYRKHGGAGYSQVQLDLAVGASFATITGTVDLPTDGTDQIVDCYLTAVTDDATGEILIHSFWLGENIT